ncbi:MAG: AMP-dependent synthetase [Flavobacteriaceae bacterium TMED179]|nr:MAG: AMP-dependent synthetase [Flavobacteriaceae bacterium TMED179]RPG56911.1 MAG: AMP-dependent synthetase [Flavobacteriales bacterium TMED235]
MSNSGLFDFKFYEWEKKAHDRPFLRQPFGDQWEEYTWAETGQMARKLAKGLKSLGLRQGAHIGLISKNCREWIIADLAIMMAGYISVPFFPSLKGRELEFLIDFGDVDLLFVGKIETWDNIKSNIPKDLPLISFPNYKGCSVVDRGEQWFDFINRKEPLHKPHIPKLSDLWTIIFTSGTTGNPKGVKLSYLALDSTKIITEQINPLKIDFSGNNDFISYLPLNHIVERVVLEHVCLRFGGSLSFVESIDSFAKNLREIQPHVFFAAPRIWTKFQLGILAKVPQKKLDILLKIPLISGLIKRKLKKNLGLKRARSTVSGSAPIPLSQIEWFRKIGIYITNGYGMTENCAICTQVDGQDFEKSDSVGKPQCGVEVKIDKKTKEVLMRGPFVMDGYYKNEKMTKATLIDGWLHTGDKGFLDEDNYLYISGRVVDSFKTSKGKFIEPLTLENYFADIKQLEEVCVTGLGLPQPIVLAQLSEIGKALPKEEVKSLLEEKITKINEDLENYKKISTLVLVKEQWTEQNKILGPTLKIKRGNIDNMYCSRHRDWHEDNQVVLFEK